MMGVCVWHGLSYLMNLSPSFRRQYRTKLIVTDLQNKTITRDRLSDEDAAACRLLLHTAPAGPDWGQRAGIRRGARPSAVDGAQDLVPYPRFSGTLAAALRRRTQRPAGSAGRPRRYRSKLSPMGMLGFSAQYAPAFRRPKSWSVTGHSTFRAWSDVDALLKRNHELSVMREQTTDIKISALVAERFRSDRLFQTMNHPDEQASDRHGEPSPSSPRLSPIGALPVTRALGYSPDSDADPSEHHPPFRFDVRRRLNALLHRRRASSDPALSYVRRVPRPVQSTSFRKYRTADRAPRTPAARRADVARRRNRHRASAARPSAISRPRGTRRCSAAVGSSSCRRASSSLAGSDTEPSGAPSTASCGSRTSSKRACGSRSRSASRSAAAISTSPASRGVASASGETSCSAGASPHSGQAGSRARRTSRTRASSASTSISRPDQRRADAEHELQCFRRLPRADHAGEHAEHAAFGAVRHEFGRRRFGIQQR